MSEEKIETQQQPIEENKKTLKAGFVVGLSPDDNFVFEVFEGTDLLALIGFLKIAEKRVQKVIDNAELSGDRLVTETIKSLQVLHQKVDTVSEVVLPKKPDNKL